MSQKYLDRKITSRASRFTLSRSTSPSLLPAIDPRRLDNFSISVKRHMTKSYNINPENSQLHSIRYYLDKELNNQEALENKEKQNLFHSRRHSLIVNRRESPYKI